MNVTSAGCRRQKRPHDEDAASLVKRWTGLVSATVVRESPQSAGRPLFLTLLYIYIYIIMYILCFLDVSSPFRTWSHYLVDLNKSTEKLDGFDK